MVLTILLWVGIAVAAVILLLIVLMVISMMTGTAPKGVEFEVESPSLVPAGEVFDATITVRNLLDQERTFYSFDLDTGLLRGFAVEKIEPTPRETTSAYGTTAHHYTLSIAPRAGIQLRLRCRALAAGDYSGKLMVFVDARHYKFASKVWRVVVR